MNAETKRRKCIKKVLKVTTWALAGALLCYVLSTCMSIVLTPSKVLVEVEVTATPTKTRWPTRTSEPTCTSTALPTATKLPTGTPIRTATSLPPTFTPTPIPELTSPSPTPTTGWIAMDVLQSARVVEVVDGDTIKVELEGAVYTIRYIGIDTPETVHPSKPVEWMGAEASAANEALVGGQEVLLEKDVSETDRYGRLLRYVHLVDGTFVNAELVRLGYAQVSTYPPDVYYQDLFLIKQQEAMSAERGLWSTPPTVAPAEPPPATAVCDCSGDVYNCKRDFTTQTQAQACYNYCMQVTGRDVHGLDGDDDGQACETLP